MVIDAVISDFRGITTLILIGLVIVAVLAYLSGRPTWARRVVSGAGDAAGRAGPKVGAVAGSAAGAVTSASSNWESMSGAVVANCATVERIGVATIAFIVLWLGDRAGHRAPRGGAVHRLRDGAARPVDVAR